MSDDYATISFCFKDYSSNVEQIDDFKDFYEGFIETNYLFIDKFLAQDNDSNNVSNNVSKAKKFIIDLAIKYYKKNNTDGKFNENITSLEEQKNLIIILQQEDVPASLVLGPPRDGAVTPASLPAPRPPAPAPAAPTSLTPTPAPAPRLPAPPKPPVPVSASDNTYSNIISNIKNMCADSSKTNFYSNNLHNPPYYLFDDTTKQIKKLIANKYRQIDFIDDKLKFTNDKKEIIYNEKVIFKEICLNNNDIVYLCLKNKIIYNIEELLKIFCNEENLDELTKYDNDNFIDAQKPVIITNNILYNDNHIIMYKTDKRYILFLKLDIPDKNIYISQDFKYLLLNNEIYFKYGIRFINTENRDTVLYHKLSERSNDIPLTYDDSLNIRQLFVLKPNNYNDTMRTIINTTNLNDFYNNSSNFININSSNCDNFVTTTIFDTNIINFDYNDSDIQTINNNIFKKVNSIKYKNETFTFSYKGFYYCTSLKLYLLIIKFHDNNYNLICIKEISCSDKNFYLNLSYNQEIYTSYTFFKFIKEFHDFEKSDYNEQLNTYNVITDKENQFIEKDNVTIINKKLKYDHNNFIIKHLTDDKYNILYKIVLFNVVENDDNIDFVDKYKKQKINLYCTYNFRKIYISNMQISLDINIHHSSVKVFKKSLIYESSNPTGTNIKFIFNLDDSVESSVKLPNIIEDLNLILMEDSSNNININNISYILIQIQHYFSVNDNYYKNIYNMFITKDSKYIVIVKGDSLEIYIKVNNYYKNFLYRNDNYELFSIDELYEIAHEPQEIHKSEIALLTDNEQSKYKEYNIKYKEIIKRIDNSHNKTINFNENELISKANEILHDISSETDKFFLIFNENPKICEIKIETNKSKYYYMFQLKKNQGDGNINHLTSDCDFYISYHNNIVISYNHLSRDYTIYKKVNDDDTQIQKYKILYYTDNSKNIVWEEEEINLILSQIYFTNITSCAISGNITTNIQLLFGGGNGEDTNEDTNNLLICIMKNIMLTNKNDFDIIKNKYKIMN